MGNDSYRGDDERCRRLCPSASCVHRGLQPRSKSSRTITREGDLVRPPALSSLISPDISQHRVRFHFSFAFSPHLPPARPRTLSVSIFFAFCRCGLFGKRDPTRRSPGWPNHRLVSLTKATYVSLDIPPTLFPSLYTNLHDPARHPRRAQEDRR